MKGFSRRGQLLNLALSVVGVAALRLTDDTQAQAEIRHAAYDAEKQEFTVEFNANTNSYYVLKSGVSPTNFLSTVGLLVTQSRTARRVFSYNPWAAAQFFSIAEVSNAAPSDLDGDGLDDIFELANPDFLNPLDGTDALRDRDGDGRSNLQEYKDGTPLDESASGFYILGQAFDQEGRAVAGATVAAYDAEAREAITDAFGRYLIRGVNTNAGPVVVGARLPRGDGPLMSGFQTGAFAPAGKVFTNSPIILRQAEFLPSGKLAVGGGHQAYIRADGTLWTWGWNDYGQLGDGTTSTNYRPEPTQVPSVKKWISVSLGQIHSVAIKEDGTLWTWGGNTLGGDSGITGQLGSGPLTNSPEPQWIARDGLWKAAAAGTYHTLALRDDGTLWAFGRNQQGQLGHWSLQNQLTPVRVGSDDPGWTSVRDWTFISAGFDYSIGIRKDGTLWAWGSDDHQKLGIESTGFVPVFPTAVAGGVSNWWSVAAGSSHTLGIANGQLWGWGENQWFQLGRTDPADHSFPEPISTLPDFILAQAGELFTAALDRNGNIWDCGYNPRLPSGTPGYNFNLRFDDGRWRGLAANGYRCVGLRNDGTVWMWDFGSISDLDTNHLSPGRIHAEEKWIGFAHGPRFMAIRENGSVWKFQWSGDKYRAKWDLVPALPRSRWSAIEQREFHGGDLALREDGTVWGSQLVSYAEAGDFRNLLPNQQWRAVSHQLDAAFAIRKDGTLWSWGFGQGLGRTNFGDGEFQPPGQIGSFTDWSELHGYGFATRSNGSLWYWGRGFEPGLPYSDTPREIRVPGPWRQVAEGTSYFLALKDDGTLWVLGRGEYGCLGLGSIDSAEVLTQIGTDSDWKLVRAGNYSSFALKNDGSLWAWGRNFGGELGDGTREDRSLPARIGNASNWADVFTGDITAGIRSDGSLWVWGQTWVGQTHPASIAKVRF